MIAASWSLQTGIYAHLRTDSALQAHIGNPARIYDAVPPEAIFPFLTIGEAQTRDYEGIEGAREHDIRIGAFSRWGGRREVKEISERIYDRLHDATFPVDGHILSQCRFVFADILQKADRDTYQSIMRYRMVTEPIL